jgi:hypothetical protein
MDLYSDCDLVVKVPLNYSKKDELIHFLKSKLEGCEIKIEEVETDEPFAKNDEVVENSQLSGLRLRRIPFSFRGCRTAVRMSQ